MSCCQSWKVEVPLCTETIIINTELPNGVYKLTISDKFARRYSTDITIADGIFSITLSDFPKELFTIYSLYLIQLFDGCDELIIGNCETEYKSIELTFVDEQTENLSFEACCN